MRLSAVTGLPPGIIFLPGFALVLMLIEGNALCFLRVFARCSVSVLLTIGCGSDGGETSATGTDVSLSTASIASVSANSISSSCGKISGSSSLALDAAASVLTCSVERRNSSDQVLLDSNAALSSSACARS